MPPVTSDSELDEQTIEELVLERKEQLVEENRAKLTEVINHHDDLVREAFHLEKFVTLVGFDPEEAKADKSAVFEKFREPYDLVANHAASSSRVTSARKTRRALTARRGTLTATDSSPVSPLKSPHVPKSASGSVNGKGKGKERSPSPIEEESPTKKASERKGHFAMPKKIYGGRGRRHSTSTHMQSPSHSPERQFATPPSVSSSRSRSSLAQTLPRASLKKKALETADPPRPLKRIKLIHNPPPLVYTHPDQLPPAPAFGKSVTAFLDSFIVLEELDTTPQERAAHARAEAAVQNRIAAFRAQGRLTSSVNIAVGHSFIDPKRSKDHWDHLVDEVVLVSRRVRELAKTRDAVTKRISKLVTSHFERVAGLDEKNRVAEEKRIRMLAKSTLKAVLGEWKQGVKIIRDRRLQELKDEERVRSKKRIDSIIKHSGQALEAQHMDLLGSRRTRRSQSGTGSISSGLLSRSMSLDREEGDTEEEMPAADSSESDSEDEQQDKVTLEYPDRLDEDILDGTSVDLISPALPNGHASPHVGSEPPNEDAPIADDDDKSLVLPTPRRQKRKAASKSSVTFDAGDEEFAGDDDESDRDGADERYLEAMEKEEEDSDDSEVDELAKDADIPLEELLRSYGYVPNPIEVSSQADSVDDERSVVSESNHPLVLNDTRDGSVAPSGTSRMDEDQTQPPDAQVLSPRSSQMDVDEVPDAFSDTEGISSPRSEPVDKDDPDEEEKDESGDDSATSNGALENIVRSTSPSADDGKIKAPFLLRGTLRPYQHAGLEWLASLNANGLNGILADEMGLGKTIQTISLLAYLACEKGNWGPHLIIVPTSVLLNWEMEFKKFLPGFKIVTYYGNTMERKQRRKGWNTEYFFNVCITSYQLVLADQHIFRRKTWQYMVLDEAHNIKNFRSQRWQTLLGFNSSRRLLLTGTPLQNNLMELWSLLYFLMPSGLSQGLGMESFANHKEFAEWFANPMDRAIESGNTMDEETRETVNKLHTLLRPYLLRRLKSEVEKQLPAKFEHLRYCRLSKRQRFLYDEFMSRAQTKETLESGNFLSIVNCLMQLRKVCNHPDLFEVRPIVTSLAMPRSVAADYEIKELLVRRRLLYEEPSDQIDLNFSGFQPTAQEGVSLIAALERRRLDASSLFPHVQDIVPDPAPRDTRSIAGFKAYEEHRSHAETVARWKQISYVNRVRCRRLPVFSRETLDVLEGISKPLLPLPVAELQRRTYLERLDVVSRMVKSYEERADSVAGIVNTFAFATPKVVAPDLPRFAVGELSSCDSDDAFSVLHRSAVKLQIAFPDPSLLQYDCGKLQELDALLRERKSGGHRILIFTQMTRVLDILEIFLNFHGYRYLRLDGSTKVEQRQIITERFNLDDRIFAFIASSRSGGVGINLTGADTVIFYDSDYNPSMDKQCEDRAHRIGQIRDVHIYRFISEHTVEESMLRKANQKRSLDDIVIQKGEFDWRKVLLDDLQMEQALAAVEDKADVEAAKMAAAEIHEEDDFRFDAATVPQPSEGADRDAPLETTGDIADVGGAEEEEEEGGSTAEYVLRFIERDWEFFGDWRVK